MEINLLPGNGFLFVELLVNKYVFLPVRSLGFGAGFVFGFLIKNEPSKSP